MKRPVFAWQFPQGSRHSQKTGFLSRGYPDFPFETCHITRVHDLLILYVGSKSFAEPTAFHHLDEPQGWGNFRHPLRGTNSRQRTLRWSHSMESFKGFQCKIYTSRIFMDFQHAFGVGVAYETPFSSTQVYSYSKKQGTSKYQLIFTFGSSKFYPTKKHPEFEVCHTPFTPSDLHSSPSTQLLCFCFRRKNQLKLYKKQKPWISIYHPPSQLTAEYPHMMVWKGGSGFFYVAVFGIFLLDF